MRSFTSCQATDMEWLFWFSLLLTFLPTTESCLSQLSTVILLKTGQSVVLPCTISPNCSSKDWQYEWFIFKESFYLRLKPLEEPDKYKLEGASLHVSSLQVSDSGIYHCAAVSHGPPAHGTQHVGMGTTLVVKEKAKIMMKNILLWLSFVLLSIYSLAVVTLIVKKYGCKRIHKTDKNISVKKMQFRNVLQEMYSRGNLDRSKQAVSRSSSQVEAGSTALNSSTGDIYQNV